VRRDKYKNVIISRFIEGGVLGKTNTCVGKNQHLKNVKKHKQKKQGINFPLLLKINI